MEILAPFQPAILIILGIAAVIGGYLGFKRIQRLDVKAIISETLSSEEGAKAIAKIASEVTRAVMTEYAKADEERTAKLIADVLAAENRARLDAERRWKDEILSSLARIMGEKLADHERVEKSEIYSELNIVLAKALRESEERQRDIMDGLRGRIAEYHAEAKAMIEHARLIAVRTANEYVQVRAENQRIESQLASISAKIEILDRLVNELVEWKKKNGKE